MQSSFVSLYMMYLTWSAMSNQPDPNCKPDLAHLVFGNSSFSAAPIAQVPYTRVVMDPLSIPYSFDLLGPDPNVKRELTTYFCVFIMRRTTPVKKLKSRKNDKKTKDN